MLTDLNPPPAEPITLSEAKTFLRVDHDDEDALIQTLITSARERLETHLNITMIQRSMQMAVSSGETIKLPRWPVVGIDRVTFDGVQTDDFDADLRCRPARVKMGAVGSPGSLEIAFTAGFGVGPSDVPAPLRQAMLLLVARGFEHRDGSPDALPLMVDALTMPYRVVGL